MPDILNSIQPGDIVSGSPPDNISPLDFISPSDNVSSTSSKKPKSWLERIREGMSPITGPTQTQLEENPPIPLPENSTYGHRFSAAQGFLPKVFTSPLNLPTAP